MRSSPALLAALVGSLAASLANGAPTALSQEFNVGASFSSAGAPGDNSSFISQVSDSGRYIVFDSFASNLVAGDANGVSDVFRRDLESGTTEPVSLAASGGGTATGLSLTPDVSADGRYVVWASLADDIVAGDVNGTWDVFLRDMATGTALRVSEGASASASSGEGPRLSANARFVVFESDGAFVPADTNGVRDVYRLDRTTGAFTLVSTSSSGALGNGDSTQPDVSDDGRLVAFTSLASNFAPGSDANGLRDVFVKDLQTGALTLVSRTGAGATGNDESQLARVAGGGGLVVFNSRASDLITPDTNGNYDIYAFDLASGALERINVRPDGSQGGNFARSRLTVSRDGNRVVFAAVSPDLVVGDTNGVQDIFLRDRAAGTTIRVSLDPGGNELFEDSFVPSMSDDGRVVAFASDSSSVVAGTTTNERQVYGRVRFPGGDIGTTYCLSNPNSTGVRATMGALGSLSTAANDLTLIARSLPTFSFTFFIVSETQGFVMNPGGSQGNLCLGGSVGRYVAPGQVQNSGGNGEISLLLDLAAIPQPLGPATGMAGDLWSFQAWFRDSASGQPVSNFTNGYALTLIP